jgi:cytochrome c biogenesis protein CcmG, thiol:disulfide interchange protein DsbE
LIHFTKGHEATLFDYFNDRMPMPHANASISFIAFTIALTTPATLAESAQDSAANQPQTTAAVAKPDVDPKWLERLPKEDRAAIDELIGFAPPSFAGDVKWLNREATGWESHRGKVILVQSFSISDPAQKKWPTRLAAIAKDWPANDIVLIALHTPEGANKAQEILAKQKTPESVAIAIDPTGKFCDELGIYKEPVNFLVDRNGVVRFAGLNAKGIDGAMAKLLQEKIDGNVRAKERPRSETASKPESSADFPAFTGKVDSARDIRGQKGPEFVVDEWITSQPQARGKVVVLDFWATWCGPCVASIPHMNSLATKFGDSVCIVGLSDEKPNDFQDGLKKRKLKLENINYALALDPAAKMKSAIQIRAIPHCIVMSQDWTVRWQGHPMSLRPQILEQIIKANASSAAPTQGSSKRRWQHDS